MSYTIHTEPEYLSESIRVLVHLYNHDPISSIKKEIQEKHGGISQTLLSQLLDDADALLIKIGSAVDLSDSKAEMLLKKRADCCELIDCLMFFEHFKAHGINRPAGAIAFVLNPDEFNPLFEFDNDQDFFRWLDRQPIIKENKYDAWKLYQDFDACQAYGHDLILQVTNLLRGETAAFQDRFKETLSRFENAVSNGFASFLGDPPCIRIDHTDQLQVYPMLFEPNGISMIYNEELGISNVCVGISFFQLAELLREKAPYRENMPEFLKVLSDPKKFMILQKLHSRKYYSGELAAALKLTGATISYHMSALVNLLLVTMEKEGTRIYYGVNDTVLRAYLKELDDILCGNAPDR